MSPQSYLIRWRGRQQGPYPLGVLRDKLAANEIGLMHEISVGNQWTNLGEFLRGLDDQRQAEQQVQLQTRQAEQQRQHTAQQELALQEVQRQNELLAEQLDEMRRQQERGSATLPPGAANPGYHSAYQMPYQMPPPVAAYRGTSGMAIAAFVCSLLNFVPYLGFISCILAIVFGHLALSEIKKSPGLGGKGLATAALIITYVLLLIGFIVGVIIGTGAYRR